MSRNAAAVRSARDSFADTLENIAAPSAATGTRDEEMRNPSADRRWNQQALRKAVLDLQSETAQAGKPPKASSRAPRLDKEAAANESALSYERALRLLARVNLDSDDLDISGDSDMSRSDLTRAKSKQSAAKARPFTGADDLTELATIKHHAKLSNSGPEQLGLRDSSLLAVNPSQNTKRQSALARKKPNNTAHSEITANRLSKKMHCRKNPVAPGTNERDESVSMRAVIKVSNGSQVESASQAPLAKSDTARQRRAAISLRLTEEELEQLRLRAEESGINVSAYIRSCVMEAENLRSQVRHVMAEVRALGAASLIQRHALPPATPQTKENESWMQSIRKAAARLCMIPFGLFGRTA